MIPQHALGALGNLSSSERQAARVRTEQDVDLIFSDEALGRHDTLLRRTRVVVESQAQW
jgi:hypothetical protein